MFQAIITNKKDKLKRGYRDELAELEERCKAGNASKQDYEKLTKLRRKMK